MRKILVLSLLFAMLAVPASAEPLTDREKNRIELNNLYVFAIQSFGWKCSQVKGSSSRMTPFISLKHDALIVEKIICENNLTYYVRSIMEGNTLKTKQRTFCHKGVCKKF